MVTRSARRTIERRAALLLLGSGALLVGCTNDESATTAGSSPSASRATTDAPVVASLPPATTGTAPPDAVIPVPATGSASEPSGPDTAQDTVPDPTTLASFVPVNADPADFAAERFTAASNAPNPWFPLTPGYQSVRQGEVNKGSRRLPHQRVLTVTDATKEIAGVRATLVLDQDFDGGELSEQALDFLAQDQDGNVWYLGSYTEAYEGGEFVNANDAWLAGVDGAKAGILMMADPQPGMARYAQATVPGEGTAKAEILERDLSLCVPFKCFTEVLLIQEDGSENTYYAPGAGGIRLEPVSGDPQETEELINLTQLGEQGLAELSDEAVRLDQHAHREASDVFGDSADAARAT